MEKFPFHEKQFKAEMKLEKLEWDGPPGPQGPGIRESMS
jgi:hypothetical protein